MDVIGKSYSSFVGESHPDKSKLSAKSNKGKTQRVQLWEAPRKQFERHSLDVRTAKYVLKGHNVRTTKPKDRVQVWRRPPTAPAKAVSRSHQRVHGRKDSRVDYFKRPSTTIHRKKIHFASSTRPEVKGSRKPSRSGGLPLKPRPRFVPGKSVLPDTVSPAEIAQLEQRIQKLQSIHGAKDVRVVHDKFAKAIDMQDAQFDTMSNSNMLLPGTDSIYKTNTKKMTAKEITLKGIEHYKNLIAKKEATLKQTKHDNEIERKIDAAKGELSMYKEISSRGGTTVPKVFVLSDEKNVDQRITIPHRKLKEEKRRVLCSTVHLNAPFAQNIPYNPDGTVVPASDRSGRNSSKYGYSTYCPHTDPLHLVLKDVGSGYSTEAQVVGNFYADPDAVQAVKCDRRAVEKSLRDTKPLL
ncbi:hypothetical protein AAMO2058_001537600 [Amorphochlora amoebiformis]|mmetsp:Transcript_32524/g.52408  ORF Transcript_32524/g.52408 Transcript_32524/m.52408 type:complete len:410 (-) Transcript_32524:69-1298(-)